MDRSRLVAALALAISAVSLIVGLFQIGAARKSQDFAPPTGALFSAGTAGVALIEVHGPIESGWGGPGRPGADRIVERIKQAESDPAIRGIILSINSPGGGVGPTKQIYDALMHFRKQKPIVAYVTDIAASGGYYLAATANKIHGYRGAIIGSIGVIMIHANADELLRKIGVAVTVIKSGRLKDSSYPFRSMTEEERLMHQKIADDAYEQFIADVSEGRKQPEANVRKWAEGRVYSGVQAKQEQMIDDFGGQDEALASMRAELKTKDDLPILKPRKEFWEEMFAGFSASEKVFMPALTGRAYYLYPDAGEISNLFSARELLK
ncbi:MAG: signal peptide peptidase SppA [Spirochaetia bacterium]|nr:signal peptide peptidase SppA [Spirochaetia bacterium]